jgi:hypothetical protein
MVSDPRVAFFSFIGSAGVGWSLRSKLAPGARCALASGLKAHVAQWRYRLTQITKPTNYAKVVSQLANCRKASMAIARVCHAFSIS